MEHRISYRRHNMASRQCDETIWESTGAICSRKMACDPELCSHKMAYYPEIAVKQGKYSLNVPEVHIAKQNLANQISGYGALFAFVLSEYVHYAPVEESYAERAEVVVWGEQGR